jgi:transglutaminase-like putative cysteine protease
MDSIIRKQVLPSMLGLWLLLLASVLGACAILHKKTPREVVITPWSMQGYVDFVRQNMADLNDRYAREYIPYFFVVDTEFGSMPIQALIDPSTFTETILRFDFKDEKSANRVARVMDYFFHEFTYVEEPQYWATAAETFARKRGDCKNLSILLLSLLTEAGVDAYAAVSNGHMWVCAFLANRWQVLETDSTPKSHRAEVYGIQGFYDNPLYKIYTHQSFKRKKLE